MANPHRGDLAFEVDGVCYTLRFSTDAFCHLEEVLNRPFASIARELADPDKARLATLRATFWAGLREHHPEIDLKRAGEIMDASDGRGMQLVDEGFRRAFPSPEMKGARPPNRAERRKARATGIGPGS